LNPFDSKTARYDEWFNSPNGRAIFTQEINCLRSLMAGSEGRWMEVGVGTGRFAAALGVREGIDPSYAMLEYASDRGVRIKKGRGEEIPYSDDTFDGLLMVVTICFLDDPDKTFKECRRVLKPDGCLIVGLVPEDSPWGEFYMQKGKEGNLFYSIARFYSCNDVIALAAGTDFIFNDARSCLFTPPGEPVTDLSVREGIVKNAGFIALKFVKKE
jgi:ubiquinone/menaquinone biosynthesis C-methylase UbiE